jgi:hypothetical protein
MFTFVPSSFMVLSQTASVELMVLPMVASRLTGPLWLERNCSITSTRRL